MPKSLHPGGPSRHNFPLTYLFTWLSDRSGGSVPVALVFHASINACIARLPLFPAFEAWTGLLWVTAAATFVLDRRLRRPTPAGRSSRYGRLTEGCDDGPRGRGTDE